MEDVLDVYHAPYDAQFPLVCMDESNKRLVGEVHAPLAPAPGRGQIIDHEYVRNGVAEIFLEVEPLSGRRHVYITLHLPRCLNCSMMVIIVTVVAVVTIVHIPALMIVMDRRILSVGVVAETL